MVNLNLVQELLDIFPNPDDAAVECPGSHTPSQLVVHLSVAAVVGAPAPKTLCLTGSLQGISLSILVDSGSSRLALQVQVANGAVLQCTEHLP